MILFINACVRKSSRTKRLADRLLSLRSQPVEEINLIDIDFPVVDEAFLMKRDWLIIEGKFGDPSFLLARQFAAADEIVIAAPFWDLSFPSSLKRYFEQINVIGITFGYSEDGVPRRLCRAKKITYVATSGGDYFPEEFGFGYVKALAQNFYGIDSVELIKANGLDLDGADEELILQDAFATIEEKF